jgi:transcriptional regulator with XRE-family HTH domain
MNAPAHDATKVLVAMRATKVTQSQIARTCGCTDALVWQVIHGRRPTARIQDAIAAAVGQPVATLFPARADAPPAVPSIGAEAASAA